MLVPPGDAKALAEAVLQLIHETDLRHRLAERARCKMQGHDWVDVATRVLELLP